MNKLCHEIMPKTRKFKCKVLRSQHPSKNQLWTHWHRRTRTWSTWSRDGTARPRTRWVMQWRIPVSLRMPAKMSQLRWPVQRPRSQSKLPKRRRRQQVHPPCSINCRPAIFSRTFSSKFCSPSCWLQSVLSWPLWWNKPALTPLEACVISNLVIFNSDLFESI